MPDYPPGRLIQSRSLDDWKAAEKGYESALEVVGKKRKAWPLLRELDEARRQVEGNSEKAVADAWKAATEELARGNLIEAVVALTALRGVGVATASAVLSTRDPSIPFMSDEAILACDVPRKYDLPTYKAVFGHIAQTAAELHKMSENEADWTAERVQQCLWASNNMPKEATGDNETGKRKRDS
ncbi:hypothetical protein FOL47_004536 [Perkinsus chesapeaki]|uniref:Uncharacterized protein n=1 Tax=Perkinsus chesapeaki TaxID=330153 RepID=A0A7J6M1T6_PERCH|nr:hypothetical protein FOL47_004536 [Perkinsus chesapeaki]